ncbi:prolyl oligopeptidase family serine peptidase [Thalassoroseus pseudoceratinae]|uniref:prolyl oligopeptidase family serine peptidase n=1 Tax=Thalassoroseus pseudoceratinae TaxID=2713176 RepID=UPI00141D9523|nr:prolyl oligopeptidase family serine peptidase [Thalassoroseus pseudoceratinae]
MKLKNCLLLVIILTITIPCLADESSPAAFPGQPKDWHGFSRYDFEVDGKSALVVAPKESAPGRPWVWHGEFFGHKPAPDIALLKQGFHIAYLRVPDMLGAPEAVAHWDTFYKELTQKYGLAEKPALVGLSRGGLYCYNWAAANPDQVACIYGDAPVCDFKSWPGGKGAGKGSPRDWKLVLQRYGFKDDAEAIAYDKNPIDNLAPLAAADVPLLHVYGDADEVVPWEENTGVLAERYRKFGGDITLIAKPGVGHHPHSLDDPSPIVEFITQHASVEKPRGRRTGRSDAVGKMAAKLTADRLMVYKKAGGRELYLHIYEPLNWKPTDRRPCFLVIHGGGWTGGEPGRMAPFADYFRLKGMVGISVQYRLLNLKQGTTVFDCVKDGRSAVRFVRSHAESLGIDPDKIIVSGGSAGGHVAVGTALFDGVDEPRESTEVSSTPNALVLLFPVIDTSPAGYGNAKIGKRWRELSPAHQVRGKVPPTLIFHGTGDTVTPFAGAEAFRDAMHKAGNRCELAAHEGGKHGYLMKDKELYFDTMTLTDKFLAKLGLNPK